MNKARAMLDALMGPDRDSMDKSNKKTEKFKDASVCKAFLVGRCPFDGTMLGGKRKFPVCDLLHSETMKAQLEAHPEAESLKLEYEAASPSLPAKTVPQISQTCSAGVAASAFLVSTSRKASRSLISSFALRMSSSFSRS
mmetsp:Transcript_12515/g.18125  ORF Transcript_12515/g.18125 Transcript_12515/m.18125 type:complete len:140 (+) Transcript_12515:185-604(+)